MSRLFEPLSFARGSAMKNRFMLAPLTNLQSHKDGTLSDEEFRWRLSTQTGRDASHLRFHAFRDIDQNIAEQVLRIRQIAFLPKQVQVRGYAYDVTTGALREVVVP